MKQLAVHHLGWAAGFIAFSQLPALASNSVPNVAQPNPYSQANLRSPQVLVAVSLSRRSLSIGDEGDDVIALQRFLSRQSLYPFLVDGVYGSETADAVATYQRIRGLSATGTADESTLIDMDFDFAATRPYTPAASNVPNQTSTLLAPNLALGDSGTDVINLQRRLQDFGIPLFVDGVYGFETQQAVRTYQRVQNIEVTGNADSATLERMGFETPNYPYIAAVIADTSLLSEVQQFFPNAYVDNNRRGRFINIGSFANRLPAEARVDAAAARGFTTRVLYSRSGLLFGQ